MTVALFSGDLKDRITTTARASLLRYWTLGESTGTAIIDYSPNAVNGTYSGVTLANAQTPFGTVAPRWDAVASYGNAYSASLASAMSSNAEGTALVFGRASSAGVWSDGVQRRFFALSDAAGANGISLHKTTTANQLRASRGVGGVFVGIANVPSAGAGTTNWFGFAVTWSQSNNRLRGWYSALGVAPAQLGSTQTGVNAWSAITLDPTKCTIGAQDTVPSQVWDGWEAHVALWTTELDPTSQLLPLMVI